MSQFPGATISSPGRIACFNSTYILLADLTFYDNIQKFETM